MASRSIEVMILGDASSLTRAFGEAEGSTSKLGGALNGAAKMAKLAGLAIAGGATVMAVKSVEAAQKFQSSMELIATQAHAPQAEVNRMSDAVVKLAGKVGTDPDSLAQGLYHLESAGLRGQKALQALTIAAEGAKVGHANLEDVTNALNATIVSGIKGASNMSNAMGTLNATVGAGDMRMEDLAEAMGTGLLAKAKVFGVSIQQVGGALATFGDNNIRGAKAATDLASAIRLMGAPSKAAAKELKTVGISGTELGDALRHGGPVEALSDLKKHLEDAGLTATQQASVLTRAFGGKQAGGILLLLGQLDRLKSKTGEITDASTKFGADWEKTQATSEFATERFKASLDGLEVQIGAALLPTVTKAMNGLSEFISFLSTSPGVADAASKAMKVFGDVIDTVTAAGKLLLDWYQKHQEAAKILVGVLAALVLAFGSPIIAITAVGVALIELYKHSTEARTIMLEAFDTIRDKINQVMPTIKSIIEQTVTAAEAIWNRFGGMLTSVAETAVKALARITGDIVQIIGGVFNLVGDLIHGRWSKVWDDLKQIVSHAMDAVETLIKAEVSIAYQEAVAIGSAITDGIIAGLGDIAHKVGGWISSGLKAAVQIGKDAIKSHSPSQLTADELGTPMGEGVVMGWIMGTASLPSKMKQSLQDAIEAARTAIQNAQGTFQSAFGGLMSVADSALDALQAKVQTKSEKALAALQAAHDAAAMTSQIADARAAIKSAKGDVGTAAAAVNKIAAAGGGTPDDVAAAQKAETDARTALVQAQQTLDDLLYQKHVAALQKKADAERLNLNATLALQKQHFDASLTALQTALSKHGASAATATADVLKLLSGYGINFKQVGQDMGVAWIEGLKEALAAAAKGAGKLSGTITDAAASITVPKRAMGGPVTAGMPYWVGERGPELYVPGASGRIVPNGAGGGGGDVINFNFPNYVGSKQELIQLLRNENQRFARQNAKGAFSS